MLNAECDWPSLHVADASAAFDDGSMAYLNGTADLEKQSVSEGRFRFNGPLARQWLPYGYSYESLALSGNFEGPFTQLRHTGHVEAGHFTSPQLQPLGLQVDWRGQRAHIESFDAKLLSTN